MELSFYKDLFNNSSDLIQSISPQGDILYVNNAWLKKLGYKKSELGDLNIFDIIHPDYLKHCQSIFNQIMSKQTSVIVPEVRFLKRNGDSILLEGQVSSSFKNNRPQYTRGIFKDITESSKTARNLEILNFITQKLNETNNLEDAYSIALDKVCELEHVDIAAIYLVDESTNEAVVQDYRNVPKTFLKRAGKIVYPKGIIWKTIKSGRVSNIQNIQDVPEMGEAGKALGARSFVGIPIKVNKKTIGVFWLLGLKEYSFNKDEIKFLNSICNHIAIAIARAKSYEEISKKNKYDVITNKILSSINSAGDLQTIMQSSVNSLVREVNSVDNASIFLVENKNAILKAHKGYPDAFMKRMKSIPYPKGFTWKTIIDGKTRYCPDTDKDKYIGPAGREIGTKSYLAVPIIDNKKAVGCIHINSLKKNAFDDSELHLMYTLANQIGTAINNAKQAEELLNSQKVLSANLEKINKQQHYDEIVSSVVKSVHQSIDLQEVFENTVDALINNIKIINHVGLHIVEDDVAIMKAYRGHPKWFVKIVKKLERPKGFTWKTINTGKMHYCPDINMDKAIGPAGIKVGTKSYVSVPITISDKTIGCINVHSKLIDPFGIDELTLIETVTNQIAIAIDNAKQAEKLRKSQTILSEKVEQLNKKQRLDAITGTILQSVHKSLRVKTIMQNAVDAITKHMHEVENIMIFLVQGNKAVLQAHRGFPKWIIERLSIIPKGRGFTWKAINSGRFNYVKDVINDKSIGPAGIALGTQSYVAIPIKIKRSTIGVICINSLQIDAFDKDDLDVLKKIPKQLEIAINNANKAEALSKSELQLQKNVALLQKKNKYEEILGEISSKVHQTIDLQTVLNSAADSLVDNLESVDNVSIFLVEGNNAVINAYKGYPKWFINITKNIPYPRGFTWQTIINGTTTYCPDISKDKAIGPAGIKVGTKSYLSIPFSYQGKTVGCINFNSRRLNAFHKDELILLENVASQIESAITNAKQAEALKESKQRFRNMADTAPVMIWMSDTNQQCTYVNKNWLEFTGETLNKELNSGWMDNIHKDDIHSAKEICKNAFNNREEFKLEFRLKRHDGQYRWIFDHGIPRFLPNGEFTGYIGSCIDINDRITAENKVKQSLQEKELLLRELHHRVKNNLQIVSSLLSLQAHSLEDESMIEMLTTSKSRIDSMALIHEQLYASPDFENIDLSIYVRNLCEYIREYANIDTNNIKMNLNIDSIVKNINFAIPFSLIINEIISNAYKHAFPNNGSGEINLSIKRDKKDNMILKVSDNGIGLSKNFNIHTSQSMGMQLISALAQQLHAKINIKGVNGTAFEFTFSGSDKK